MRPATNRHRSSRLAWCWALLAGLWSTPLSAQAPASDQALAELKAQIVFRTMLFIDWPAGQLRPGQALSLCLLEDSPLATALLGLAGRTINGHALEPRRLRADQASTCHAALLGPTTDTGPLQQAGRALLLVSDAPAMLGRGVMLNLQVEDGRVVFDIGLASAHRASLEFSTKLLRLARFVQRS